MVRCLKSGEKNGKVEIKKPKKCQIYFLAKSSNQGRTIKENLASANMQAKFSTLLLINLFKTLFNLTNDVRSSSVEGGTSIALPHSTENVFVCSK